MRSTTFIVLLAVLAAMSVQAQEMEVTWEDGQDEEYSLSEIIRVTFAESDFLRMRDSKDILRVRESDDITLFWVAAIDSVTFLDNETMYVHNANGVVSEFDLAEVTNLKFIKSSNVVVTITYDSTSAVVDNPWEDAGVEVDITDGDVTINSEGDIDGITYALSGTASDGMFKIYSDDDITLQLCGVDITNSDGPAINIQNGGTITVELVGGTSSTLSDGETYADPVGDEEQDGCFFSEDQLLFIGSGSLTINGQGSDQHGLCCDDYIDVRSGNIIIQSAVKDGIHTNDGYYQYGGSVDVTSASDGIDAGDGPVEIAGGVLAVLNTDSDREAVKSDSLLVVSGGSVDLTIDGHQSRGLSADHIHLTGGTITIATSGDAVLEESGLGYDPSYCTAVRPGVEGLIDGCDLSITTGGTAGRGISGNGNITIESGTVNITSSGDGDTFTNELGEEDVYHGPCMRADGDLNIEGGTVTLSHSGSAGRGISVDGILTIGTALAGPALSITTTGDEIPVGIGATEAKAAAVDSMVVIENGEINISSANDGIKCDYWIEVNDGLIDIADCSDGLQAPNVVVNGGELDVSAGDDVISAGERIEINGGLITSEECAEGLEAPNIFINGGELRIAAEDDAVNATYGYGGGQYDGSVLTISDGYIYVDAEEGDGIDSNGDLTISGGTVIVHGAPTGAETGIDASGTLLTDGGFTVVSQYNSSMIETPSGSSNQRSVNLNSTSTFSGGTIIRVETSSGDALFTFEPAHNYQAVLFSSDELMSGTTYNVYTGGSCTGTEQDGVYTGGTYSGGTLRATFTSSGVTQEVEF